MLSFAVPTFTKPEALPMSSWKSKLKPYKTPPCPTDRFTTDRKDSVYSCFFLLLGEIFFGNSSPCASMKRRVEKGQKWFPWMKPYIIRYLLGIGAVAVVVVTLCVG